MEAAFEALSLNSTHRRGARQRGGTHQRGTRQRDDARQRGGAPRRGTHQRQNNSDPRGKRSAPPSLCRVPVNNRGDEMEVLKVKPSVRRYGPLGTTAIHSYDDLDGCLTIKLDRHLIYSRINEIVEYDGRYIYDPPTSPSPEKLTELAAMHVHYKSTFAAFKHGEGTLEEMCRLNMAYVDLIGEVIGPIDLEAGSNMDYVARNIIALKEKTGRIVWSREFFLNVFDEGPCLY